MEREDAERLVANFTERDHFSYVPDRFAVVLLGRDAFDIMKADPVRGLGPFADTTYPWNVVDYLCGYRWKR